MLLPTNFDEQKIKNQKYKSSSMGKRKDAKLEISHLLVFQVLQIAFPAIFLIFRNCYKQIKDKVCPIFEAGGCKSNHQPIITKSKKKLTKYANSRKIGEIQIQDFWTIVYNYLIGYMSIKLTTKSLIFALLLSLFVNGLQITPTKTHLESPPVHQDHRERPGCKEVDQATNRCLECTDPACTQINDDGFCICEHNYERPNKETGICEPCYIPGCASCERNQDMTCGVCLDPEATLANGVCTCPAGKKLDNDGQCHACEVKGCDACQAGSLDSCSECIDSSAVLKEGKCICPQNNQTLNFFGYCSYCLVRGCDECTWSATECHTCKNAEATLIDGECQCPVDKPMNNDGECQECAINHCSACVTGNKDKCDCCEQGFDLVNGKCQCPENEVEQDGRCHPKIPCCVSYDQNSNCVHTTDDTTLVDGECVCAETGKKVDDDGQCIECQIVKCKKCEETNKCVECLGDLILQGNECGCPIGTYIQPDNTCGPCQVPGCKKCSPESDQICEECLDCNMELKDGKCLCPGQFQMPNEQGQCSYCFRPNCLQCNPYNNKRCRRCQDGFKKRKGQCVKLDNEPEAVTEQQTEEEQTQESQTQEQQTQEQQTQEEQTQEIAEVGKQCNVFKCKTCQKNNPNVCKVCKGDFKEVDGVCQRRCHRDGTLNNCRYCEADNKKHCKMCINGWQPSDDKTRCIRQTKQPQPQIIF